MEIVMSRKKTMTLNLAESEMDLLEKLAKRQELSKTALLKQALRLYRNVIERIVAGDKLFFEDELGNKKTELMFL